MFYEFVVSEYPKVDTEDAIDSTKKLVCSLAEEEERGERALVYIVEKRNRA
jgi:hypothetical protein